MSEPSTFCGLCGTPNLAGATVCTTCGALLAAYQAAPGPIPAAAEQTPSFDPGPAPARPDASRAENAPEPTFSDPGGAASELFGQADITLKPIELEPLHFDDVEVEPVPMPDNRPTEEPIDAEFRPKTRPAAPPSPKPAPSRPVAMRVEPKRADAPPSQPGFQQMYGGRPTFSRLQVFTLGRWARLFTLVCVALLIVACVVIATGHGFWGALAFCFVTIALLGNVTGIIIWKRRKARVDR